MNYYWVCMAIFVIYPLRVLYPLKQCLKNTFFFSFNIIEFNFEYKITNYSLRLFDNNFIYRPQTTILARAVDLGQGEIWFLSWRLIIYHRSNLSSCSENDNIILDRFSRFAYLFFGDELQASNNTASTTMSGIEQNNFQLSFFIVLCFK